MTFDQETSAVPNIKAPQATARRQRQKVPDTQRTLERVKVFVFVLCIINSPPVRRRENQNVEIQMPNA